MHSSQCLFIIFARLMSVTPSLASPLERGLSSIAVQSRDDVAPYYGNPSSTCSEIVAKLPSNTTFIAASSEYNELYQDPWSQTCWLQPACIVTPVNEQQLADTLSILTTTNTKFAIRSGGHSSSPGFSSVGSNGILVSLQNFNKLVISSDSKTITVGTGNRWEDVYSYVGGHNLTVIGGREPPVGVGGFLLGGGLGIFYNTFGLGLDNIVRYRIMLTDGKIVNATETENSQLYRGLKGGLANFGIVLEFEIMTYQTTQITFGISVYSPNNTEAVLKAYANYLITNPDDQTNIEIQVTSQSTLVFYGKVGQTNDLSWFKDFVLIPVALVEVPWANSTINTVVFNIGGQDKSPGGTYGAVFAHKVINSSFFLQSYQTYLKQVANAPAGVSLMYSPQGITTNLVAAGKTKNGGNILGLSEVPQAWVNYYTGYSNLSIAPEANALVDEFVSTMSQQAKYQGISLPYLYANDASASQKVLEGYGASNLNYIKATAEIYDPKGYMQRLQNDGYLISKA